MTLSDNQIQIDSMGMTHKGYLEDEVKTSLQTIHRKIGDFIGQIREGMIHDLDKIHKIIDDEVGRDLI